MRPIKLFLIIVLMLSSMCLVTSCTRSPPDHLDNICLIFKQYNDWYWDAEAAQRKWGVPISVQMAIIYQESHYNATARPARQHILWVIPWFRPTSAYGYSQAVNQTWKLYRRQTGNGDASRNAFHAATDFIGWFAARARRKLGIKQYQAFRLYLAYHEGLLGYKRGTYRHKRWLIDVAHRVQRIAWIYHAQLKRCEGQLRQKPFWKRVWDTI